MYSAVLRSRKELLTIHNADSYECTSYVNLRELFGSRAQLLYHLALGSLFVIIVIDERVDCIFIVQCRNRDPCRDTVSYGRDQYAILESSTSNLRRVGSTVAFAGVSDVSKLIFDRSRTCSAERRTSTAGPD